MKNFDGRIYSISDFIEWRQSNLLIVSPKFQRRQVWSKQAKSYLMDTILRGKPMPKILLAQELNDLKTVRTVIDGQQRLTAILEFVVDGYPLMKSHHPEYGGMRFSDLPGDVRDEFMQYQIGVDVIFNLDIPQMLDIFARINTYSVTLNTQEKRNARYFGAFKTFAYELGHELAPYLLKGKVLSEGAISRMGEAELASDLLIAIVGGVQTNKNIERYYKKYEVADEVPEELISARKQFLDTLGYLDVLYKPEELAVTNWSRQHWFYTLFTVIAHAIKPLKGLDQQLKPSINLGVVAQWRVELDSISANYDQFTKDEVEDVPEEYQKLIDYSRRRTTDTEARVGRANMALAKLVEA